MYSLLGSEKKIVLENIMIKIFKNVRLMFYLTYFFQFCKQKCLKFPLFFI